MVDRDLDSIREEFKKGEMWGLLTSIDLHDCDPGIIRSREKIKEYVDKLCEEIDMRKFGETAVVHFGEDEKVEGFSMTQLIETSLISGHFANATNKAFIDIFSCKYYNPDIVAEFTKDFFKARVAGIQAIPRK